MMNLPETSKARSNEISLKELIQKLQATITYLWGYKGKLALMAVLGGVFGFGYAHFFKEVTYTSRLTFVVEEKSAGGGSLMGLASQFGVDLGMGGAGLFSTDNLLLLLRSNRIVQQALLVPNAEFKGGNLLNAYVHHNYEKKLAKGKLALVDPLKTRAEFSRLEDSTLTFIINELVMDYVTVSRLDKKSTIMDIQVRSTDEKWAFEFSKLLIRQALDLYVELKIGKTKRTVKILESRVDSVKAALDIAMGSAAIESDQNQSLVLMRARVPVAKKQMQVQLLTTMYGELVKNLELTKFTLDREEPVIVIIDSPSLPLKRQSRGRAVFTLIGGFVLVFSAASVLLVKRYLEN
jgi:uncharacterized protein involved in exopolysaccharide biosynthesis